MNEDKLIQVVNNQAKEIDQLKATVQKMNYQNGKQKDTINAQSKNINSLEARLVKIESILSRRLR